MTTAAAAAPIRAALHAQLLDIERQHRAALDTERNILRAAQERLKAVNARIEAVRPRVLLDDRAADPYQALILERGALHQTVALAEQTVRQTSRGAEPPLAKATFKDQPGYDLHEGPKGKNRWMREMGQDGRMSNSDGDFLEGRSRSRGELPKHAKPSVPGTLPVDRLSKLEGDARAYVVGQGKKDGNEHLYAYDLMSGRVLARVTSDRRNAVAVPDELTKLASDPDQQIAYHHGHPDSFSLSLSDLKLLNRRLGLAKVVAHGHDGSQYQATRGDMRNFDAILSSADSEMDRQADLVRRRGASIAGLDAHLVNLALAAEGVIEYQYMLSPALSAHFEKDRAAYERIVDELRYAVKRAR